MQIAAMRDRNPVRGQKLAATYARIYWGVHHCRPDILTLLCAAPQRHGRRPHDEAEALARGWKQAGLVHSGSAVQRHLRKDMLAGLGLDDGASGAGVL